MKHPQTQVKITLNYVPGFAMPLAKVVNNN